MSVVTSADGTRLALDVRGPTDAPVVGLGPRQDHAGQR